MKNFGYSSIGIMGKIETIVKILSNAEKKPASHIHEIAGNVSYQQRIGKYLAKKGLLNVEEVDYMFGYAKMTGKVYSLSSDGEKFLQNWKEMKRMVE